MLNDETRRKLRVLNIDEFIEELEIQQQDPQTFVDDCRSIVFQGYPSSGKTFLGCAMAKEACRAQHKTRYIRLPDLLGEYAEKSLLPDGKNKVLNKYAAFKGLVLDEWLMLLASG